jgi:hypothetical protein
MRDELGPFSKRAARRVMTDIEEPSGSRAHLLLLKCMRTGVRRYLGTDAPRAAFAFF